MSRFQTSETIAAKRHASTTTLEGDPAVRDQPKTQVNLVEGDLTPMIDMTFQLIAFFMVLINFTEADQDERIKLPTSVLAKPATARSKVRSRSTWPAMALPSWRVTSCLWRNCEEG